MGMAGIENRADRLRDFVAAIGQTPCKWGKDDCTAWAARWVEQERAIGLGLPEYDEASGRAMIAARGGLVRIWTEALAPFSIPETDTPVLGDVGIIESRIFGPVGVIFCADGLCVWRASRGATFIRPRTILKAWAI